MTGPALPGDSPDFDTHSLASSAATSLAMGPYQLRQKIGDGGMGEVWMADQLTPMRRTVAIKIIKAGMDTTRVVGRFEAERQALALMDHPAIATVFDGGSTLDGRPFFAMEYVKGEPITAYCDRHRLSTRDRIELLIRVCEGVQHAHQKGVIHRDLKPSNVLVTLQDNRPVPKIIDFGVAKATGQPLTERTLFTEMGMLIGTPEYMSPEQAELTGLDVDTRADVYALGVILYELLTGTLPFDRRRLRDSGFDAFRQMMREVDPPRPSTRTTEPGSLSADAARNRRTEPSRLRELLCGDLDWITMKALEKDRTRRYDTVMGLAADLRRHLNEEPVLAGPPSATYRTGKFIRRHRFGVSVGLAAVVLLVGFAIAMAIEVRRVGTERDRANQESRRASMEAVAALQVSDFLTRLFQITDPSEARGRNVTAREILDAGARTIESTLSEQPSLQSRLTETMAGAYEGLGLYDISEKLLRHTVDVRRRSHATPTEMGQAFHSLGHVLVRRGNFAEAEAVLNEALALRRSSLGATSAAVAKTLAALGELAYEKGDYPVAEARYRQVLDMLRALPPGQEEAIADAANDLAMCIQQTKADYAAAKVLMAESLASRRRLLAAPHPKIAQSLNNLAMISYRLKEYETAQSLFTESLAMNRTLFGEPHPEVAANLNNLALLARDRGDYARSVDLFQQTVAMDRQIHGPDNIEVGRSLNGLAESLRLSGKAADAASAVRDSIAIHTRAVSAANWQTAATKMLLVRCLADTHEFVEAERLLGEAFPIIEAQFGPAHPRVRTNAERAVALYAAWGKPDKAAAWRKKMESPDPSLRTR